jgi:hypothetical protein
VLLKILAQPQRIKYKPTPLTTLSANRSCIHAPKTEQQLKKPSHRELPQPVLKNWPLLKKGEQDSSHIAVKRIAHSVQI